MRAVFFAVALGRVEEEGRGEVFKREEGLFRDYEIIRWDFVKTLA